MQNQHSYVITEERSDEESLPLPEFTRFREKRDPAPAPSLRSGLRLRVTQI